MTHRIGFIGFIYEGKKYLKPLNENTLGFENAFGTRKALFLLDLLFQKRKVIFAYFIDTEEILRAQ